MGGVLRNDVHVTKEDHSVVILRRGSTVPDELAEYVTNPKAYASDVESDAEQGESGDTSGDTGYQSWKVPDLKAELKKRELPQGGTHDELVLRLTESDAEQGESGDTSGDTGSADENTEE